MSEGQRIEIPAILLETEHPHTPASAGDGQLHVTARDPHWLYVHWDLTRDQQTKLNSESSHGHLVVRAYVNSLNSRPSTETTVHPQSRHWFVHVEIPDATYYVELGLYVGKEWRRVAVAGPITTPRKRFAFDTSATYITIRPDLPLAEQVEPNRPYDASNGPAVQAFADYEATSVSTDWSPEQQLAVLRALGVIRVTETVCHGSGAGGLVAEHEVTGEFSLETDSSRSAGGFGETQDASRFSGVSLSPASSADASLFSPAEFPNSSS